ncbi:MAG: hypothetical protein FOGNACKC_03126 [Anaerolineae bacterium]|nr:hypothetical protein [Anaerolineae bacterium]
MLRVLIAENHLLLGAGLEVWLGKESGLTIWGNATVGQIDLLQEIRRFQPDVIILDADTLLTTPFWLLANLQDLPRLQIVLVSANNDLIQIYNKVQVSATQAADLIKIIKRGENPPLPDTQGGVIL